MLRRLANGYRFLEELGDGEGTGAGGTGSTDGAGGTGDKTVQYGTYKRTVDQLKASQSNASTLQSELDTYKEKERIAEEKRLSEQGEYQKLLEIEREKNKVSEAKNTEHERTMLNAHKLNAFREKLPGKLKNNAYYDFVDIDNIIIDPTSGVIDDSSLDVVVNGFIKDHSALIDSANMADLPGNAAKNSATALTHEEWLKLPTLAERKKRFQEMRRNDLNKS